MEIVKLDKIFFGGLFGVESFVPVASTGWLSIDQIQVSNRPSRHVGFFIGEMVLAARRDDGRFPVYCWSPRLATVPFLVNKQVL